MAVAVPGASLAALVRSRSYVLGHLGLQNLLHHPLADLAQEAGIVQQDLLRHLHIHPTMIFGHRHSVSDRLLLTPTILEDDGPSF